MKFFAVLILLSFAATTAADLHENVDVQLINVYLSTVDSNHKFVSDLRPEDLILREDGTIQRILGISNLATEQGPTAQAREPLMVAFAIDTSASMSGVTDNGSGKMTLVKTAALEMLKELQNKDQMSVIGFNYLPRTIIPPTSNKLEISDQISMLRPLNAPTALLDSLFLIVDQMRKYPGRKFLVLGSDGIDTTSHTKLEDLLDQLKTSDLTLLVFGLPSYDPGRGDGRYVLEKIAETTGGYVFFLEKADDLPVVLAELRKALRSQYLVWYSPQASAGQNSWHSIQIDCRRPGVDLHYRKGYLADVSSNQSEGVASFNGGK